MFCKKCGHEMADNARFCPNCGENVSAINEVKNAAAEMADSAERGLGDAINEVRDTFNGKDRATGPDGTVNEAQPLTENRSLGMYVLLSIVTCGIYAWYFIYKMAHDTNIACAGDDETTSGLVMYIVLSVITCGIYSLYWQYKIGNRLAANAHRYGLTFQENGTTVLMWEIFGVCLCCVGPFIAMNILIKNTNKICHAYNVQHGLV